MKKFIIILIGLFWGITTLLIPQEAKASSFSKEQKKELAKITVENYFKKSLEKYNTNQDSVDFEGIINSNKTEVKEYLEKKCILGITRRKAFNLEVIDKEYYLTYNSINIDDNYCNIKVNLFETLQYNDSNEPTYISTNHDIELEFINGRYYINNDISDDEIDTEVRDKIDIDEYVNMDKQCIKEEKFEELNQKIKFESNNLNISNIKSTLSTKSTSKSFDRNKMYNYAAANWNSRPSNWGNFDGYGGDCTNFISQILYAGGAPMDTTGNLTWYYYSMSNRAPAWTSVQYLYNYLINNDYIGPQGYTSSGYVYTAQKGDIIQVDFTKDGTYEHSLCIVQHSAGTTTSTKVAAHSNNSWNRPLSDYSGNKRWILLSGYME